MSFHVVFIVGRVYRSDNFLVCEKDCRRQTWLDAGVRVQRKKKMSHSQQLGRRCQFFRGFRWGLCYR